MVEIALDVEANKKQWTGSAIHHPAACSSQRPWKHKPGRHQTPDNAAATNEIHNKAGRAYLQQNRHERIYRWGGAKYPTVNQPWICHIHIKQSVAQRYVSGCQPPTQIPPNKDHGTTQRLQPDGPSRLMTGNRHPGWGCKGILLCRRHYQNLTPGDGVFSRSDGHVLRRCDTFHQGPCGPSDLYKPISVLHWKCQSLLSSVAHDHNFCRLTGRLLCNSVYHQICFRLQIRSAIHRHDDIVHF